MQYRLITTREGQVPIEEVKEGTEVLSLGEWKKAPAPVKAKAIRCCFDTLPTTIFEKKFADFKREVSISHSIVQNKLVEELPELAIEGHFKSDKKSTFTLFKGLDSLPYWLPKFIKYYDEPILPTITAIGYNLKHSPKESRELKGNELAERNLEHVLEGMLRKSFCRAMEKWFVLPSSSWNETHRIVLRLLDIECQNLMNKRTVVKNPVSLYRHVRDDHNKAKITDEAIVYDLKRSAELPPYTSGHRIVKKEEVFDWVLPGINPDVNTINPENCHDKGFTKMAIIRPESTTKYKNAENCRVYRKNYLQNNFFSIITENNEIFHR